MSKWESETFGIESRAQLVAYARLCSKNPNADQTGIERFTEGVEGIEKSKGVKGSPGLKANILALSTDDRAIYFKEIDVVDPGDIAVWLTATTEELVDRNVALDDAINNAINFAQLKDVLMGNIGHRRD